MDRARKNRIKRIITSDFHLWIALATAVGYFFVKFLNELGWLHWEPSSEGLLVIITFCLAVLLADRLWEGEKLWEQICDNTEKLVRIAEATADRGEITLRSCPKSAEDYDYLWGGFTKTYCVYNPSYKVDIRTGKHQSVQTFLRRYQHPRFDKAQYLFLTHDADGENALKVFRGLMLEVQQHFPDVRKKIEVRQNKKKKACSAPEMYLGERDGVPTGVLELKKPTLSQQHGQPHYYLIIHDRQVVESYISDHFSEWNNPDAKDVENFWGPGS